jgi:peptidoglycan/LPS O-acetylase OafA/YrhL
MSERNNFDLLRLGLASMVFLVHAYVLSLAPALEPLDRWLSTDFAIKGFFAVSGYLVLMSYENSASVKEYFDKRARRIVPAYLFVIVAAFAVGAFVTDRAFDRYLGEGALRYLAANAVFANFLAPSLPGVFTTNPLTAVNGALWTLKIEVLFYLTLPVIVMLFRRFGRLRVVVTLYLLSVLYVVALGMLAQRSGQEGYLVLARQYPGQLSYFMCGGLMYYAALPLRRPRYVGALALACAYLAFAGINEPLLGPLAVSYVVIFFALGFPYLGNFGRFGDFSYGVYILHFPILQWLVWRGAFAAEPLLAFAVACVTVVVCAVLLWHLVEKRFLRRSSHYRRAASEPGSAQEGR